VAAQALEVGAGWFAGGVDAHGALRYREDRMLDPAPIGRGAVNESQVLFGGRASLELRGVERHEFPLLGHRDDATRSAVEAVDDRWLYLRVGDLVAVAVLEARQQVALHAGGGRVNGEVG